MRHVVGFTVAQHVTPDNSMYAFLAKGACVHVASCFVFFPEHTKAPHVGTSKPRNSDLGSKDKQEVQSNSFGSKLATILCFAPSSS